MSSWISYYGVNGVKFEPKDNTLRRLLPPFRIWQKRSQRFRLTARAKPSKPQSAVI